MADYTKQAQVLNKNKKLVSIGDLAISEKFGVGKVILIEVFEDVLRPILVEFPKCSNPQHHHLSGYNTWYDCNGEGNTEEDSVIFYTRLNLKNL